MITFRHLLAILCICFFVFGCSITPDSQAELDSKLWTAIKYAKVEKVKYLLEKGANPNLEGRVDAYTTISPNALISACQYVIMKKEDATNSEVRERYQELMEQGASIDKYEEVRTLIEEAKNE